MTINGLEIGPSVLPWTVIGDDSIEHPATFNECLNLMNNWLAPLEVFDGEINQDRFYEMEARDDVDRSGVILVWIGALPDPDFEEPGPGGIADLTWDETGGIWVADIVIDYEHAYDEQTFRDRFLHELGHTLGLDHDEDSLDLGSCMSSPPAWNCGLTDGDVELVHEWENR